LDSAYVPRILSEGKDTIVSKCITLCYEHLHVMLGLIISLDILLRGEGEEEEEEEEEEG
jgi:hypothetical protein